jgi:ATP-dependent DNA helicase RecQ
LGIIYRTTRKNVERTAEMLRANGFGAAAYHAGLDSDVRKAAQEDFRRDRARVVVATIAFGMGIDKSNVRYIVHADLPKSIEAYYQETGRAGRDGEPAHCLMLFADADAATVRYLIDQGENEAARQEDHRRLEQVLQYARRHACRRHRLLAYFDEDYGEDNCGSCDVCAGRFDQVDATTHAQMLMSAVVRTGQRFGTGHVVDVVTGSDTRRIRQLGHDRVKTHGVGRDRPKAYWKNLCGQLLAQGHLEATDGRYPQLRLTDKGQEVLYSRAKFIMLQHRQEARDHAHTARPVSGPEAELVDRLKEVRRTLAESADVPPYVIFSDRTLAEMARLAPADRGQLLGVSGVGEHKARTYGSRFLAAIERFRRSHPEYIPRGRARAPGRPERSRRPKRTLADTAWASLELSREGLDVAEIARRRGLKATTVYGHLEQCIRAGRLTDIDAYVPPAVQERIADLLGRHGHAVLKPIFEAGRGEFTYEQIRLVRAMLQATPRPG